ncbi:hypothetical protein CJF32_00011240 [Rutstroemia sp. NJR-2017a WRK4]|nr:hypothetical protein CJF32_00011240 [Rutstroemia sp. NJR-2017a WRK4]
MGTKSGNHHSMRDRFPVDYIFVDLGTGGLRMAYSNEGDEKCREIGNYPGAQAGTPSLVSQAPSNIIYEPHDDKPATPIAFGHVIPRRRQRLVSNVKIALLPDPESYGYTHSLLVDAADSLRLSSVQQIPEDFLKLAIQHAVKECRGQPNKGWVFSVPQYYKIDEVQNYRALVQRAGCIGPVDIHGESDSVAYANLPMIEQIVRGAKDIAFEKGENFTIKAGIFDLGAGTTDVTTSEICFKCDGTPPTISELKAPFGFPIGGDIFDERFVDVLRTKLEIDITPDKEEKHIKSFVQRFHTASKPQWPTHFEDDEYPFRVSKGQNPFELSVEDMEHIMEPPTEEIRQRICKYLSKLGLLDLVVISGGNSEMPSMIPSMRAILTEKRIVNREENVIHLAGHTSNAVVHGLHYWVNHSQLVKARYARTTLAFVVRRPLKELGGVDIPKDARSGSFYNGVTRMITEGELVPHGIKFVDIFFDIRANSTKLDLLPIDICVPESNNSFYTHKCKTIGEIDLSPMITDVKISQLKVVPKKHWRRLWLRLGIEVGIDINITIFWTANGLPVTEDRNPYSATLTLENLKLPNQTLSVGFRAPRQQRERSGSSITNDTLPSYLDQLKRNPLPITPSHSGKRISVTSSPKNSD